MKIRCLPSAVRRLPVGALIAVVLLGLQVGACESTQSKSERLAKQGGGALEERGLVVRKRNADVKVVSARTVQDENGAAVVVRLRNKGRRTLALVPISIDVRGAKGRTLFRNDDPGLESALVRVPLLPPGREVTWVNDQVIAAGRARSATAKVGKAHAVRGGSIPRIALTRPRLEADPVSGLSAVGFAANRSPVEQRKLVIFAVARRGSRVVAAGRAQIGRLKPGKRARYTVFFIGNPRRAHVEVSAPPSRLGGRQ